MCATLRCRRSFLHSSPVPVGEELAVRCVAIQWSVIQWLAMLLLVMH